MEETTSDDGLSRDTDIYFIPYLKTEICKLDINTLQITLAFPATEIGLGYGPHLCLLSPTKIFLQGGIVNEEFISDSFEVDLLTGTITEKAYGPINAAGTCVRKGNFIFIFGGATRGIYEPSPLSQKYDIGNDQWSNLTPLPVPSYNNSGVPWGKAIALVGQHLSSVYHYDIEEDNYTVDHALPGTYKIITAYNGIIFVITASEIHVFENGEWKIFPQTAGLYSCTYSYHVLKDNYIYMITPPQEILRLDINTKVLVKINTNTI